MKLIKVMLAAPLLAVTLGAQAQTSTGATGTAAAAPEGRATFCQRHPDRCAARANQLQQNCADNPQRCAQNEEKLKQDCAAHPEACTAVKQQIQSNQAAVSAGCQQNPTGCQNAENRIQSRMMGRQERRQEFMKLKQQGSGTAQPAAPAPAQQ
jgi:predicted transglutaminase-like cysteine proteinase